MLDDPADDANVFARVLICVDKLPQNFPLEAFLFMYIFLVFSNYCFENPRNSSSSSLPEVRIPVFALIDGRRQPDIEHLRFLTSPVRPELLLMSQCGQVSSQHLKIIV
uniref:(northern house mosquito) hypothetical protein n=1 Tax=Culex pipiens TaxID=7175 RepID=A0A8D8GTM2_CULPI